MSLRPNTFRVSDSLEVGEAMTKENEMKTETTEKEAARTLADEERTLRELIAQLPTLAVAFARSNRDQHKPIRRGRLHAV